MTLNNGLCTKKRVGDVIFIEHQDAILEITLENVDGKSVYLRLRGPKSFKFKFETSNGEILHGLDSKKSGNK